MGHTGVHRANRATLTALSILVVLVSLSSAPRAICQSNGKTCGNQGVPSNDRLCCPGSVCGWGNVCNPGCRINGVLYRSGDVNPANSCQLCTPYTSTTSWSSRSNGTACNDHNGCTQTDKCQAGVCTGSNPVVCAPPDQCHQAGSCVPATGHCSYPNKPNGCACNDASACTLGETCQSGSCTPAVSVACSADQCHQGGACDPASGLCPDPAVPDGTACDDENPCTGPDTCSAGQCSGSPVQCVTPPNTQCYLPIGTCGGSGECLYLFRHNGDSCDDHDSDTTNDHCQDGECVGNPT